MLELLAPAGSMEAVAAAVQNGTDAVYLGYGDFNARRNAKNFSEEEFAAAVSYCHLRGAKVYLTLNTLLTDRELPKAAEVAAQASAIGADAVLIQDLGVLRMLRQVAPDLPVHASTQMTLHNLDGVKMAADLGLTRAVLSRELSRAFPPTPAGALKMRSSPQRTFRWKREPTHFAKQRKCVKMGFLGSGKRSPFSTSKGIM